MATANDIFDEFLTDRGHETQTETAAWEENYNKKKCPECGGLHEMSAAECTVCGWGPN